MRRGERPNGSVERFDLPVYRVVLSLPPPDKPWDPEEIEKIPGMPARPEHLVALADGALVFTAPNLARIGSILPGQ